MPVNAPPLRPHKITRGMLEDSPMFAWFRSWRMRRARQWELGNFGAGELAHVAHDVTAAELHALSSHKPRSADKLPKMMNALGVDPDEALASEPATFRDMQRLCTLCESHGRCQRDLTLGTAQEAYFEYCPNAKTIERLRAAPDSRRCRPAPSDR